MDQWPLGISPQKQSNLASWRRATSAPIRLHSRNGEVPMSKGLNISKGPGEQCHRPSGSSHPFRLNCSFPLRNCDGSPLHRVVWKRNVLINKLAKGVPSGIRCFTMLVPTLHPQCRKTIKHCTGVSENLMLNQYFTRLDSQRFRKVKIMTLDINNGYRLVSSGVGTKPIVHSIVVNPSK